MKVAYSDIYIYQLPEGHRFPMEKYELLPQQLLLENVVEENDFFEPDPCSDEILLWTHSPEYLHKLMHLDLSRKEER
ncbi:MAG: histone deacetylase, partial [Saprospiraceae bacterium]|nr:histone deacetylase [Saprospiraceae bacterium]